MSDHDPRLRDLIRPDIGPETDVQVIGFPSDAGVKRNGGRPGAAQSPGLIYDQLLKLTPHAHWIKRHTELLRKCSGLTLVPCSGDVEKDQEKLGKATSQCLIEGQLPVIIGGGHETSFGHFLGYAGSEKKVHILNLDAHADVRPLKNGKAHSGSPFRQAAEHASGVFSSYTVFGLNPASVSEEHIGFVNRHGAAIYEQELKLSGIRKWFESVKAGESVMATMDMDLVRQADAPGVSAPNASGITARKWLRIAHELGRQPAVSSFDLCEVNPEYDIDGRTVRLAALTVWYFLLGVALR
jgi:formiminoglutamase